MSKKLKEVLGHDAPKVRQGLDPGEVSWVELNARDRNYHDRSTLDCGRAPSGRWDARWEIAEVGFCI